MEAGFVAQVSDYQHYVKNFEKSCFQAVLVTRTHFLNFVADFFNKYFRKGEGWRFFLLEAQPVEFRSSACSVQLIDLTRDIVNHQLCLCYAHLLL